MQENSLLGIMEIAGPIILLLLFVWVIMRNRKSKVSKDITDAATRANYQAEDSASKKDDI